MRLLALGAIGVRESGKSNPGGIPELALTYCDGHHSVKIHLGLLRKHPGAFAPSRIHRLPRLGPSHQSGAFINPAICF